MTNSVFDRELRLAYAAETMESDSPATVTRAKNLIDLGQFLFSCYEMLSLRCSGKAEHD